MAITVVLVELVVYAIYVTAYVFTDSFGCKLIEKNIKDLSAFYRKSSSLKKMIARLVFSI